MKRGDRPFPLRYSPIPLHDLCACVVKWMAIAKGIATLNDSSPKSTFDIFYLVSAIWESVEAYRSLFLRTIGYDST